MTEADILRIKYVSNGTDYRNTILFPGECRMHPAICTITSYQQGDRQSELRNLPCTKSGRDMVCDRRRSGENAIPAQKHFYR